MPELAGATTRAPVEPAIQNHAQTHTSPQTDHQEVADAPPSAKPLLGHGQGVDVVIQDDRYAEPILKDLRQGQVVPPEVGGKTDNFATPVDDAGHANADAEQGRAIGCRRQHPNSRCQRIDDIFWTMRADRDAVMRDDTGAEVGQHRNRRRFREFDADDVACPWVEGDQYGTTPTRGSASGLLVNQAGFDQLCRDAGDSRHTQIGLHSNFRP